MENFKGQLKYPEIRRAILYGRTTLIIEKLFYNKILFHKILKLA